MSETDKYEALAAGCRNCGTTTSAAAYLREHFVTREEHFALSANCSALTAERDRLRAALEGIKQIVHRRQLPITHQVYDAVQAARDAAARLMPCNTLAECERVADVRVGRYDCDRRVQAFARFEQDVIARLATRPAPVGEPVAWMYERPWEDYTPSREVRIEPWATDVGRYAGWIETPLYTRPALDVDGLVEKVARAMLDSIENGGNMTDFLDHLADYPERALSKLATTALAAIKDATDAQ